MKNKIRLIGILLGISILICSACHKDHEPSYCEAEGIILGIDYRECACCGGWFIEIDKDTLRAIDLPQSFKQGLDPSEFPLPVYLEWSPDDTPCLGDEIEVLCIRRKE